MKATAAVAELLQEAAEWRRFYRQCCETGALRLRSQSWQFRDELRRRGAWFELEEVEDALLVIARKVLPETPATRWDQEWAHELCWDAMARVQERYSNLSAEQREALDLSGQDEWDEQMHAAGVANDPAAFREALRGWERTALGALEAAKERSGAA